MDTKPTFPHPCTRCGMCCLAEVCPQGMLQITGNTLPLTAPRVAGPCPFLSIDEKGVAACGLVTSGTVLPLEIGSGRGCCMKARILCRTPSGTREMDYPSLPAADKVRYVANVMDHKGIVVRNGTHQKGVAA